MIVSYRKYYSVNKLLTKRQMHYQFYSVWNMWGRGMRSFRHCLVFLIYIQATKFSSRCWRTFLLSLRYESSKFRSKLTVNVYVID